MAIFTVNNNNDSGLGSLRQAITDANAVIGLDTIEFDNSLSGQEITLTSGELQITDDLTINGLGVDFLTISGNNNFRVFLIDDGDGGNIIDVNLNNLQIIEGNSEGISNRENLTIDSSTISGNTGNAVSQGNITILNSLISDNDGGIFTMSNSLIVKDSTISENGSGLSVLLGNVTVDNSLIANNSSSGISVERGSFEVENSIISGNTTTGGSSAIFLGTMTVGSVSNSTITNNISDSDGDGSGSGAIVSFGFTGVVFENTIVADNFDNSPNEADQYPDIIGMNFDDGSNTIRSNGYNFIGDITGTDPNVFTAIGDLFGTSGNPLAVSDIVEGTSGNDSLAGTSDRDRIEGGDGNDTLRGRNNIDVLLGEAGNDVLIGSNGNDVLNGGIDNDTLNGGTGHDQMFGGAGDDRLVARDGNDTLNGGTGRDVLIGGAGSDRFMLVSGVTGDRDIIRDYQDGVDRLIFTGDLSFNDLNIAQAGNNTRIRETATNQTLAILTGLDSTLLNQHDFEFGAGDNGIRVEAEDYVGFFDTTAGNTGGEYRNDNVDIEATTDIGGGFNVGYINDGEWLTYNVNIPQSGSYKVVARVASNTTDDRVHHLDISLDGQSTSLGFDATGGWQSWTDVIGDNLDLSVGSHELRFDMGSSGFNINYVDLIPV